MKPRAYQAEAIDAILNRFSTDQRTLAVVPTGGGKTIIAAHVAHKFLPSGRVMVIAHRDELIKQAVDKFQTVTGEIPAIEKADQYSDEENMHGPPPIVVSSVQTLNSGNDERRRMHRFDWTKFAFLWVDEGHHAIADTYRRVIDHATSANPNLKVLLVTATADRADGEKLGQVVQSCAFRMELPDIINQGYLVPIRQRSVTIEGLDFSKVRTTAGDFNSADLEAAMLYERPLHGVIHATIELACGLERGTLEAMKDDPDRANKLSAMLASKPPRRTLIFTVTVAHAERVAEILNRWIGESAAHVDGSMPLDKRADILSDFKSGRIRFLANCMIATEGFDMPEVEVVVMARPTKSRSLFTQMVGRGTRPLESIAHQLGDMADADARRAAIAASAKAYMEVLDFVGNSGKHKLVTAIDVLGDERYDPEVIERANEIAQEESIDIEAALERADDEIELERDVELLFAEAESERLAAEEEAERLRQAEAAKRAALVGVAQYEVSEIDAFDAMAVSAPQSSDLTRTGGASDKQVSFLVKLGVRRETAMTYGRKQASAIISKMLAQKESRESNAGLYQRGAVA
jgi:superfamily II DNA or RNA helicase